MNLDALERLAQAAETERGRLRALFDDAGRWGRTDDR